MRHHTHAPFKVTNDALNMTHRGDAARVAFKGIDLVHQERPEAQVHGTALLFLALCERNGVDPRECLYRAERILASRHDISERRANQFFAAVADYIDHLYDPKRGHPDQ